MARSMQDTDSLGSSIHRSARKGYSAKFALTEFSEVHVSSTDRFEPREPRRPDCHNALLGGVEFRDGLRVHTTPLPQGVGRRRHLPSPAKRGGLRTPWARPEARIVARPEGEPLARPEGLALA